VPTANDLLTKELATERTNTQDVGDVVGLIVVCDNTDIESFRVSVDRLPFSGRFL
jgi:hypothetical protein